MGFLESLGRPKLQEWLEQGREQALLRDKGFLAFEFLQDVGLTAIERLLNLWGHKQCLLTLAE
jgi:hypothetical protein